MTTTIRCLLPLRGREKDTWAKLVDGVDRTRTDGYAFDGKFIDLNSRVDLPVGRLVVRATKRNRRTTIFEYARVPEDAKAWEFSEQYTRTTFLDFRDKVAEMLGVIQAEKPQAGTLTAVSRWLSDLGIPASPGQTIQLAILVDDFHEFRDEKGDARR